MDDIRSYASVKKWVAEVNRYYNLSDAEWEGRLGALADFCRHMDRDPDAMIREALDEKGAKVDFMRGLRRWAKEAHPSPQAAHDADGIVRSFFIHNGARVVVRPYEE